jgi:hypothetical protein
VRLHLTLEECEGRNCSGIENDVAQWKRTGQKGLCAFASDTGKKRDQLDETKTQSAASFCYWSQVVFAFRTRDIAHSLCVGMRSSAGSATRTREVIRKNGSRCEKRDCI